MRLYPYVAKQKYGKFVLVSLFFLFNLLVHKMSPKNLSEKVTHTMVPNPLRSDT